MVALSFSFLLDEIIEVVSTIFNVTERPRIKSRYIGKGLSHTSSHKITVLEACVARSLCYSWATCILCAGVSFNDSFVSQDIQCTSIPFL